MTHEPTSDSRPYRTLPRKQRKVHHKVKTGCGACKKRHQKCDEGKPTCAGCTRYSTECIYEAGTSSSPESVGVGVVDRKSPAASSCVSHAPSLGLACVPCPTLNLNDLELLHQWLTSTCITTGQLPEVTKHVQSTVPPLAIRYPFVMHGLLAMAATDLANLRPARRDHYSWLAAVHHDNGIPAFRSALARFELHERFAVILYSKSILWCALASTVEGDYAGVAVEEGGAWLPQWFHLLRGSCQIVLASRHHARRFELPQLEGEEMYANNVDDERFVALMDAGPLVDASPVFLPTVSVLREAFARSGVQPQNTPLRNAVNFWAGSLTDEYVAAVQDREPWALVVMAHFAVLVHRVEGGKRTPGHAQVLLMEILSMLKAKWRPYVEWPCSELQIPLD